ncbi:DNA-directed RNA polymerase III subunit 1 isoform X2 [Camellia sinensis]|uniref:DNA-directed RNA polymerase III subunit 1 isoform X1 n=2 Tax=Camellia sinensis TaxID=4442 RepID=UPI001035993E|nr:DNA-directed RNA polymerase III subunit 1 isoform X1 [Camellia sinensis]XP_028071828.1 DNA-directed RNA polymerase III subunit 1 isoform X2 [Camellia sinensis]
MANKPQETLQFTKKPYVEDIGPRKIKSIQFSMFSESDIYKAAEVEVYRGVYYDQFKKPHENGLLDPRMGPPNKFSFCATCHGSFTDCPGHYGYLTLALPVYNVGYLSTIVDILKCICKSCSRVLLLEKERVEFLKKMRNSRIEPLKKSEILKLMVKRCNGMASSRKAVKCSRCGYINGMVKKAIGILGVIHDRSKIIDDSLEECRSAISHTTESRASINMPPILNPDRVLSLFKNILDEDCELLYLSDRPENLIVTNIAVPPLAIRPSVFVDGGTQSNESDITERLKRIIQANASLQQELSETISNSKSLAGWADLQMEVAQYINSDVRGVPFHMQAAKPLSGFVQRLKGKQGRFRGNLSGKRVEYTGRTVISPDPNLKITEVAIPILMARTLTYPERVSHHNIEKLRQCVRNGPDKYPGARFIRNTDGNLLSLMFSYRKRLADDLKFGDIVDRHLEDGDIVLFNRQPSLHRMSIMCHRARIMPWRTLRFNESVCNPYNADFDGDEMNMHVPQTEEARTEALMLMGVQNNLCTPKNGEILVASTQDFLTSSFLITRKDTFYDRASFSLICSYMGDGMDLVNLPTPALIKPIELWTGKQLFNVLLRPDANMRVYLNLSVREKNYSKSGETMCPNDGFVYFRNSELICGQLGKATLGNGNKDGLYSVLLRDYNAHAAAACMNRLAKLSARWIGNHGFSIGIDDVQPGGRLNENKSARILEGYGKCDELIQSYNKGMLKLQPGCDAAQTLEAQITGVLNNIRETTAKVCMDELHWRNSPLIMSQCGSKGSPINISQMIACVGQQSVGGRRAPNGFIDRSLPHFPRKSKAPDAKGFVANSFYSGLTATEFFFHTMGGREGLVDTAVKTADTGYMSRRLIKALEDLSIQYDNTVRNASGCIVQFVYGDDGMDPSQMEGKGGVPLNFERLLLKVKATCPPGEQKSSSSSEILKLSNERLSKYDMTPDGGCSDAFKESLSEFIQECSRRLKRTRKALKLDDEQVEGENCNILENVAQNISGVTSRQLQVFSEICFSRYHLKRIESGTAIGAIGAQSIGEPGTQMTLKTFHFAGVASMNVTLGVPRIKEIINAAKKISTPIITATLECDDNLKTARMVKGRVEKTVLGEVAKSVRIVITSRSASIVVTLDMESIQASQLCINAQIVKEKILQSKIKLKEQHIKVLDARKLEIIPPGDKSKLHFELHSLKNKLPTVVVKGTNTVERAVINKTKKDNKEQYNLLVEGTGLQAVMGTEGIDGCKTTSNHIMEVRQVIGIEAARKCIIEEIKYTMASHGMTIDIRHMMLLADLMTFKGEVLGITRHGIQKMKDSVLMLASFEKTADHLFNASVNGRDDKIEGVSECIIMGIPMQIGTGILKVRQRVENAQQLSYGLDPIIQ